MVDIRREILYPQIQEVTPYIQSLVACAPDTLLLNIRSRGYKWAREGGAPKFLMRDEI